MRKIRKKIKSRLRRSAKNFKAWIKIETLPDNIYFRLGTRVFLVVLLTWLSLVLTPGRRTYDPFFDIQVGSVADRDVIAPFDFPVYKNEAQLERERLEAAAAVMPVLEFLPDVKETVLQDVFSFFDRLSALSGDSLIAAELKGWKGYLDRKDTEPGQFTIKPVVLNSLYSIDSLLSLSDEQIVYLFDPAGSNILRNRLKDFLVSRLREGVISGEDLDRIENENVKLRREGEENVIGQNELLSVPRVLEQSRTAVVDPKYPEISKSLFIQSSSRYLRPNIIYNWSETERLRRLAAESVKITEDEPVLKGEKIVGRGDRVTREKIERLDNLRAELEKRQLLAGETNQVKRELGITMIYLVLLLLMGLYLFFHRSDLYDRFSKLLIIAISFAIVLLCSGFIIASQELPNYLLPVTIASMLIAYLIDDEVAIFGTFCLALMLGVQANFSIYVVLLALTGGIAGALSVRKISSRRAQYLPILYISGSYLLVLFAIDFAYRGEEINSVLAAAGWCGVNATLSTFITIPLLPLFEYVFKITSNFTLLELSDLNRPLLKRLAMEAPGTYHHSIIIGSLAEAAAAGIGANPIFARVGGYYHDIGKLKQPHYFIENQTGKPNPHNKLNPKMSSLIIANHVKEGLELARKAKLPECIIDIIRQHHGNQPISFFFSKEKEQNPDTTLVERDFCYPGPKPATREAAIIMLADAVESASRALAEPTVNRIKSMIRKLIEARLRDGQLERTDLTLRDLTRIGEEFLTILIGVHHHRIDYPQPAGYQQDAKQKSASPGAASGKNGQNEARGTVYTAQENDNRNTELP